MRRIDWKTRGKKALRATVAALVSLWVLYVVAINVFLSTSLFDRVVNRDRITLDVHYARGWSLWPSTIHAKHLSIRSSDSNVMWMLELDDVTFEIALLDIPRRRFTIESAHGQGISMRIQTKRMTWPDHQDEIKDLPPIAGFPAFMVRPADPHHPELWDDAQYHLITVHLDQIQADDVRELWIDDYRFSGHANVHGRFYLKPLREVDVGPAHVEILSGELSRGFGRTLVRDLGGHADVTVARFDPRAVHDHEPLRYVDIATKLHGRSIDLSQMPFEPPANFYFGGVVDAKNIELRINKGKLADGTALDATVEHPHIAKKGFLGDGELAIHANVTNGRLRAETNFAEWRVVRADGEELVRAPRAYASLDSADLDLATTPFEDLHLATGVDEAMIVDARIGNCLLPCSVRIRGGTGSLSARAEIWPNAYRVAASGRLKYRGFHGVVPELDAGGNGDVRATFASFQWDTGIMEGVDVESDFDDSWVSAKALPLRRIDLGNGNFAFRSERLELADPLAAPYDAEAELARVATEEGIRLDRAVLAVRSRKESLAVDAHANGGHVRDGAKLTFLPFRLASDHGQFRGRALLISSHDAVRGQLNIASERLGITTMHVRVVGNSDIALDIRQFVSKKTLNLGPSKIEIRNAHGFVDGKAAFTADRVELDGVAKHLDLSAPSLKPIDAHLVVAGLAAPDVRALWNSQGRIRLTGGALKVDGEIAIAGEETATGHLTVDATHASFAHGESTLTGDLRLEAKVTGASESIVHLDGSKLALRNLEVHRSSFETANWSGDVVLDNAFVDWASGTPAFAADVALTARDARPVLGMLHVPKIAGAFVTMPDLALRGHLDLDPDGFLLSDVYAHGGDVAFRGSYAVADGDKRGAFVVSKGPIAVGIRLGKDGAHPRFFGLDGWLRDEEKKVKSAPIAPGKP